MIDVLTVLFYPYEWHAGLYTVDGAAGFIDALAFSSGTARSCDCRTNCAKRFISMRAFCVGYRGVRCILQLPNNVKWLISLEEPLPCMVLLYVNTICEKEAITNRSSQTASREVCL
jgi:hypothetical protein